MPTTKAKPKQRAWDVQFVSCELSKETREEVKKFDPKYTATWDGLDRLIAAGYKVSISQDTYHECVGVFCTMPDTEHVHHGFCLTARGPNWLEAMKVLIYKHFNILQEHWDTEVTRNRSESQWG